MSASLVFKAGALALACASTAAASYVIKDDFSGSTFFDNFYFNDTLDPTHGFVEYIGAGDSRLSSLAYYDPSTNTSIMRVDSTKTYTPGVDLGRLSIRAQTNNVYQYGLFILDLAHMPGGACGSWPAFWTTSNDHWPEQGEIDIIENVNFATYSEETLHAGPTFPGDLCEVVGNVNTLPNGQQTGMQTSYNCMWNATTSDYGSKTQYSGQGCSANNNNANNFGSDFNLVGGGVYAMEWSDEIIQMWSWQNGLAPGDIANGTPDPTTWGNPIFTTWGGNCDIARHFIDHIVIFDTTFCGDWGNAVWESTTCYQNDPVKYPTCADYVGANPTDYAETYWEVRSLKVYEFQNPVVSSTSTTSASTTSTTSTSSAAGTTAVSSTTSTAAATTSLGPEPTFGSWVEIGCYTEATNSRALTLGTKVNYSTMDLSICADYCQSLNAVYFGVEYSGECYCGDVLEAGSVPSPDGGCVMPCSGNPVEICGGSDRLNVYKYSPAGAVSTSSSTTSSSTSSAAATTSTSSTSSSSSAAASSTSSSSSSAAATSSPAAASISSASSSTSIAAASSSTSPLSSLATSSPVHVETVGSCQRLGCYTEGYNIRALTPFVHTDYAYMSPEICQSMCPDYLYFGVEFTGECYCGNSINNGSTIVLDTECSMPCGGFPDEYCGAGDRLDLYYCGSGSSSSSSSSSSAASSTSSSLPAAQSSTSSYPSSPSSSTSSYPAAASPSTSSYPASPSSSTSGYPAAASSSTSSYPASPSSSTSGYSAAASSSTSSYPASPSSSTSSYPAWPSSSTSSHPASPSSSTSSYPASPSSSTSSYPASPAGAATSYPASPSSSTIGYPASPSSSTSSSSCTSSHTESSSPSTPPSYSTAESSLSYSQSYTTETITTTTCRTISSCAPTVTNCPYGKIVTDTIAITTTYCPGNPTITPTPTPYSQKALEAYTTVVVTSYVDYCPGNGQLTTIVYSQTQVLPASPTYEAAIPMYTTTKTWTSAGETVCATLTIPSGAPVPTPETPATYLATPASPITSSLPVVKMVTETVKPVAYTPSSNYTVTASGSAAPLSYSASPYAASPYSASSYAASPYPTTSPVAYKGAASGLQVGSGLALAIVFAVAALFL